VTALPYAARVIAAAVLALALAAALRFWLLEVPAIGWQCRVVDPPLWCRLFAGFGFFLRSHAFGVASLLIAGAAFFAAKRSLAMIAIASGAAGLVLYNAELGAAAALLGAMRAVRL
jgi:hypothetical protein